MTRDPLASLIVAEIFAALTLAIAAGPVAAGALIAGASGAAALWLLDRRRRQGGGGEPDNLRRLDADRAGAVRIDPLAAVPAGPDGWETAAARLVTARGLLRQARDPWLVGRRGRLLARAEAHVDFVLEEWLLPSAKATGLGGGDGRR